METLLFTEPSTGQRPVEDCIENIHVVPTQIHRQGIYKRLAQLSKLSVQEIHVVPYIKKLDAAPGIYELKIRAPSHMQYRILFIMRGSTCVLLHLFLKKSDNYRREIELSISRMKKYDEI